MTYTKEDKVLIKNLKKAGTALTGEETSEELAKLAENISTPNTPVGSGITQITFKLRSGKIRVFNEELHGEDFVAIAKEFEDSNTAPKESTVNTFKDYIVEKSEA